VITAVIEIPLEGDQQVRVRQGISRFPAGPEFVFAGALSGRLRFCSEHAGERWRSVGRTGAGGRAEFLGMRAAVRPIGMLEMMDQGLADEKICAWGRIIRGTRMCGTTRNLPAHAEGDLLTSLRSTRILKASGGDQGVAGCIVCTREGSGGAAAVYR